MTTGSDAAGLSLAELFAALSLATDVADGFPYEKALRTCVLSMRLAAAYGVEPGALADVYYCALLRYIACTSFAHEEAWHYSSGDDIQLRWTMAEVDPARPKDLIAKVVKNLGRGSGPVGRPRAVAAMLTHPNAPKLHAAAQSEAGVRLAEQLGMPKGVADALEQVCERWDGKGGPNQVEGEQLTTVARIVQLADIAEIIHHRHGPDVAVEEIRTRRAGHLAPDVVDVFLDDPADHLAGLDGPSVWDEVLELEPRPGRTVPVHRVPDVGLAFARYVDLKSVWTLDHSQGVGRLAAAAGADAGMNEAELSELHLAALLHDIGRVGIPNRVWDKPAAFNPAERERMVSHSYVGERILRQSPAIKPVAAIAGAAHEQLGGEGYHKATSAAGLGRAARIVAAADRMHAMTESRPHRPALTVEAATAQLHEDVRAGELDADAVDAVLAAAGAGATRAPRRNSYGLTDREVEVLGLVARGCSNKDIARELGISAKTVQHHVAHVYEKVGCTSRAGAALVAMQEGLVPA